MGFVEFIFSSIWIYLGFFLLIYIPIHEICHTIRCKFRTRALLKMLEGIDDPTYFKELVEDERKEARRGRTK